MKHVNLAEAREIYSKNGDVEATLSALRAKGWSQIDCIKFLRDTLKIDISNAKQIIDRSETWSDMRLVNRELHEAAEQAARELLDESE